MKYLAGFRVADKLDDNALVLGLAGNVLGSLVLGSIGIDDDAELTAVLVAASQGLRLVGSRSILAAVNRVGQIGVQDGRVDAGVDVLGQSQDGAGVGDGERPLLAVDARGHGPELVRASVVGAQEAEVGGDVGNVIGVQVLRLAAVDAVADLGSSLAAGRSGFQRSGGGRGDEKRLKDNLGEDGHCEGMGI